MMSFPSSCPSFVPLSLSRFLIITCTSLCDFPGNMFLEVLCPCLLLRVKRESVKGRIKTYSLLLVLYFRKPIQQLSFMIQYLKFIALGVKEEKQPKSWWKIFFDFMLGIIEPGWATWRLYSLTLSILWIGSVAEYFHYIYIHLLLIPGTQQ